MRSKSVFGKIIVLLLTGIICSVCFCGCADRKEVTETTEEVQDESVCIGMSFDSFVIERWEKDRDVFVSKAKEFGAEVNVQNANGEVEEQIKQIEYFINSGVDAIVIVSVDCGALSDVVKKAQSKGIKVISYDRLIQDANVDLYISFDNEMVGSLMAQALVDNGLPNGRVLKLAGPTTDNNVLLVEQGFSKVIDENNIEIVDEINADGWKADIAAEYVAENIDLVSSVDGIMCGNDNIATAVIRTLAENRLAGKIAIVGQDADLEACQHIVEGTQVMTVYKPVEKLAERAAIAAVALAKGNDLGETTTINDGSYDVPAIVLEPIMVTKDNMDEEIIGSGFHLKEEVYLNVLK